MTRYVNKDSVIAELVRRLSLLENGTANPDVIARVEGVVKGYKSILDFLDTLEVKEMKEEKIRKEIYTYLFNELNNTKQLTPRTNEFERWLKWLKYDEQKFDIIVEKAKTEKQRVLLTESDGNANIDWDTCSLNDAETLLECGLEYVKKLKATTPYKDANKEYWRGYREGKQEVLDKYAELEKQGESKNIDSDDLATLEIWEDAIKENKEKWQLSDWFVEATSLLIQKVKRIENNDNINIKGSRVMLNACINVLRTVGHSHLSDWLEKQGKQMPIDKIEPKFKVGDWIISNKAHEDYRVCKITDIKNGYYTIESIYGYKGYNHFNVFEESYRLWAIQDAQDGDLLACNEEILLFKSYSVQGRISLYCWYNGHTNNFHSKEVVDTLMTTRNKICPATKEQRDLLFSKMNEAGYERNAAKKELKKIVEKHSWKPGDIIRLKNDNGKRWQLAKSSEPEVYEEWFISEIRESGVAGGWVSTDILDTDYVFVESPLDEAALLVEKEFEKVKSAVSECKEETSWSEEDDRTLGYLLAVLEDGIPTDSGKMEKIVGWLKSLKERYSWKPSDEQMKALANALSLAKNCGEESAFDLRTLYEDLKKIEFNPDTFIEESYQQQADDLIDMVTGKSAWSEEDAAHTRGILSVLQIARSKALVEQYKDSINSDIDWLTSIKQRIR